MNKIKENWLPLLLVAIGYIANNTVVLTEMLTKINAPDWLFSVVSGAGMLWAAFKLFNSKSASIKAEIEEALAKDPKEEARNFIGTPNVPKGK